MTEKLIIAMDMWVTLVLSIPHPGKAASAKTVSATRQIIGLKADCYFLIGLKVDCNFLVHISTIPPGARHLSPTHT